MTEPGTRFAMLRAKGAQCSEHHGDVWRMAETHRWGLGRLLWRLYTWRRAFGPDTVLPGSFGVARARCPRRGLFVDCSFSDLLAEQQRLQRR